METLQFERQLIELRPTLYHFTRKFTSDREESWDLVQDTILKALNNKTKFRNDVNLKGWLYTIMRNTFINQYRKQSKMKMSKGEKSDFQYLNIEDEHTYNRPENAAQIKEVWGKINAIKEELSKPFKMYTSGYKYHEIAEHLQLPLGTVKNRIFQARQEIQKQLTGYC
jgi:RNA polymerase sigma-70 factor (ECF subfamily)